MAEDSKREIVRAIVDKQLIGKITQKELGRAVGSMGADRFTEGIDGLIDDEVLSPPAYDSKRKEVNYNFNPGLAKRKGYL